MVPRLAAGWPSRDQIWRVNAATEVLPLVPVTAAITAGCRGNIRAAANASARRALTTRTTATPAGTGALGSSFDNDSNGAGRNRRSNELRAVRLGAGDGDE